MLAQRAHNKDAADAGVAAHPLELLRATKDPIARAQLLNDCTGRWTELAASYQPSPVEVLLSKELGVW
jgi:hypothetical protein